MEREDFDKRISNRSNRAPVDTSEITQITKIIKSQLFSGSMPHRWEQKITDLTLEGEFTPKQVYFIFVDAYNTYPDRGLDSFAQLAKSIQKAKRVKKYPGDFIQYGGYWIMEARAKTNEKPSEEEMNRLCVSLEKVFFFGSMPYKWYRIVSDLIEDDGLNAAQVYFVFADSYNENRWDPDSSCSKKPFAISIAKAKKIKYLQ